HCNALNTASSSSFQRRNLQQGSNSQHLKRINQRRLNSVVAGRPPSAHEEARRSPPSSSFNFNKELQSVSNSNC
ncbi:hypothetical protein Dimus_005615, partial [Dionaea muscipula]